MVRNVLPRHLGPSQLSSWISGLGALAVVKLTWQASGGVIQDRFGKTFHEPRALTSQIAMSDSAQIPEPPSAAKVTRRRRTIPTNKRDLALHIPKSP